MLAPGNGPRVEPLDGSNADLIGFNGIPSHHETLDDLVSQPLDWIGIRTGGRIVAALAYRVADGICDIDRLVGE